MAHKVHPKVFRLKNLADWSSRWLDSKRIPQFLEEDFKIRDFIQKKLGKVGIEKVEIERFAGRTIVMIFTSRPGLIIGRGGEGIETLRKEILKRVFSIHTASASKKGKEKALELRIEVKEVKDPWTSASLTAQWVAQQLERRMPARRILKQCLEKIMVVKTNKGARVEIAGRLEGADIARREWLRKGNLPRQTLRADIDYSTAQAMIPQGILGIKVWIYKGDKFE